MQIFMTPIIIFHIKVISPTEVILLFVVLAYSWRMMQKEKHEQQELLVHQSKLASMEELIGNIAHQWKQPLT